MGRSNRQRLARYSSAYRLERIVLVTASRPPPNPHREASGPDAVRFSPLPSPPSHLSLPSLDLWTSSHSHRPRVRLLLDPRQQADRPCSLRRVNSSPSVVRGVPFSVRFRPPTSVTISHQTPRPSSLRDQLHPEGHEFHRLR
ncbi:hypothetical protein VTN00DRAFT_1446 [Thermoascus crustaceus]|uniref:uncharacterized protein n=1 Tax=Thermoascus crustaceus TaxID=5088 RepID=UPI0037445171